MIAEDAYKSIRQHACAPACPLPHHSGCNHVFHIGSCVLTSDKTTAKPCCARENLAANCQSACSVYVKAAAYLQSAIDSVLTRPDAAMQLGTGPKNKERQFACAWCLQQRVRPQAAAHLQQTHCTLCLTAPLHSVCQCTLVFKATRDLRVNLTRISSQLPVSDLGE